MKSLNGAKEDTLKTHLKSDFRDDKPICNANSLRLIVTTDKSKVDCKVCLEMIAYNSGRISEYRIAGNYDKTGNLRKNIRGKNAIN